MFVKRNQLRDAFINRALEETGYTARPNGTNAYSDRVGYSGNGLPWDGAFIDVIARDVGLPLTAHVYTASALSEFVRNRRLYTKPQRGDIVFFSFPAEPTEAFNGPHVGIVLDVDHWDSKGLIQTVEANAASGLPKGNQATDGVYKRVRHSTEVLGFGRPKFKAARHRDVEGLTAVIPARLRSGKPNRDIEIVQLALSTVTAARDMQRGHWCPRTKAAYANFQRTVGYVGTDVTGLPDVPSLQRLGTETASFKVDGS